MEKLKRQTGESLVELLLSMLIISLGMLMLAGAITTTARLNKTAREISTGKDENSLALPAMSEIKVQVTLSGDTLANDVTVIFSGNNMELYSYG